MGWKQIVCITTLALLVGQSATKTAPTTETTTAPTTETTTAPTTPPTTGPPISYNCSLNGDITINTTNLMATSHRIAIGQDKDESRVNYANANQNKCQYADSTPNNNKITLSGCNTSSPIYVYLMNQNSSIIVGGKNNHAYELSCDFPKDGFQMVVSAGPISVNQTNAYSNETHEFDLGNIGLTMTITPQTPHLGDELILNITETNQGLYVLPTECTATGTDIAEKQQLLTKGKAVDVNLLENFDVANKGSAVASMYAFRFKTSVVVRVTCNVTICQTKDCVGAYTTTITTTTMPETTVTPQSGRRRRRSVEKATPGRTYDVSAAFEILDNDPNESSSSSTSVRVNPLLTGLSLLCLWAVASSKTS